MSRKGISPIGRTHEEAMAKLASESKEYRDELARIEPFMRIATQMIIRRGELGLTQEELADRVGTSSTAISRIESGQHKTSVTTLQRLADALDLDLAIDLKKRSKSRGKRGPLAA